MAFHTPRALNAASIQTAETGGAPAVLSATGRPFGADVSVSFLITRLFPFARGVSPRLRPEGPLKPRGPRAPGPDCNNAGPGPAAFAPTPAAVLVPQLPGPPPSGALGVPRSVGVTLVPVSVPRLWGRELWG